MHTLTITTKFTFGDEVRFDSSLQRCRGIGTIFAITIDVNGQVDYMISKKGSQYDDLQPGILEGEIELLEG